MKIVIDSNILFRILISQGDILPIFFSENIEIFAPLRLKEEFQKHDREIRNKSDLSDNEYDELVEILFSRINFVAIEEYKNNLPNSKELLKEHSKDEDFLALALYLNCKIWTYESRFFDLGFAVTTKQLSKI